MNHVYPLAVDAFLRGDIDVETATLLAELLDGYTYSDTHEFLDDVSGRFATPQSVTVTGVSDGAVDVDDITFPSVPAGDTITTLVLYVDTGVDSTSRLLVAFDRRGDTTAVSMPTNDGDVTFSFPRGCFKL